MKIVSLLSSQKTKLTSDGLELRVVVYCYFVIKLDVVSLGGFVGPSNFYLRELEIPSNDRTLNLLGVKQKLVFVI